MIGTSCYCLYIFTLSTNQPTNQQVTSAQQVVVEVSEQTDRIVLTKGKGYTMLSARIPASRIFHVTEHGIAKQILQVLTHFNVKVRKSDLFSRCPVCNGGHFVKQTREDIKAKQNFGGVPAGVLEIISEFFECSECFKVYWEGP